MTRRTLSVTMVLIAVQCSAAYGEREAMHKRGLELERGGELVDLKDAAALTWLAVEREHDQRTADAIKQLGRAIDFVDMRLASTAGQLSSADVDAVLRWAHQQDELAYSICARHPKDAAVVAFGARIARVRKARDIERSAEIFRRVRQLPAGDARRTALEQAAEDLSTLTVYSYGKRQPEVAAATKTIRQRLVDRERELAAQQLIGGFVMPEMDLPPISQGAAVDFVAYRSFDFSTTEMRWGEPRYAAFVTTYSINALPPVFYALGARDKIDALIREAQAALRDKNSDPKPATRAVYDALIAPLVPSLTEPMMGAVATIILVPDGNLSSVPFDALWDGTRWLADRYGFHYAVSTRYRDLVSFTPESKNGRRDVTIVADPIMPAGGRLTDSLTGLSGLPGTRKEANAIAGLLGRATMLAGERATVGAVRAAHPGILHIATHGLALASAGDAPATETARAVEVDPGTEPAPALTPLSPVDPLSALLRAALVFSGAGALRDKGARLAHGDQGVGDDGLLSAEEVLGMNLEGTQLVTLSACQTASGETQAGAGLYGLPRAFAISGAETVVGSLWPVDDRATADLMVRFYARVVRGQSRGEALRGAMRSVRHSFPHPYYWAPFVLVGASGASIWGISDPLGSQPQGGSDELPDAIVLGSSEPQTHKLHSPTAWSSFKPGPRWEPLWESESGHRERQAMESRVGLVNVWSFEDGGTLHNMMEVTARTPEGHFGPNRDVELGRFPFSRDAGAQSDAKMPEDGRIVVRSYQYPTAASPGWLDAVEVVRDAQGAAKVARHYRGAFIDGRRPDWAR